MLWCTYRYSYSYAVTGDSGESPAHRHSLLAVAADGSVIRGGDSDSERRRRPTGDSLPSMQSCDSPVSVFYV